MAIKEHNVQLISQLAGAAAALTSVTNSDNATNNILARIVELAKDEQVEKASPGVSATITSECSARADADSNQAQAGELPLTDAQEARKKWGDFQRLASNPNTTIAELREAVLGLGHIGLGITVI